MSYLKNIRTIEDFILLANSESTQYNRKSIIKTFEVYCKVTFNKNIQTVIDDLILISKTEPTQVEDLLQNYIKKGLAENCANSVKVHYSIITRLLKYLGVTMDRDNLKIVLSFPRVSHEELTPMTKQVIRALMDFASPKEKAKLILQATSGLRNQEVCALRKKDIQTNFGRWIIHVSHESAKYKKARISFLSLEAQRFLEPIIRDLKPDDLIFVSPTISLRNAKNSEIQKFIRLRKLVGLDERYKTNNFGKYTTHGLRSFFITQSDKIHEGFGHALAGHGQRYMVQYERFTLDEKLNFYLEVEPSLAIYDNIDVSSKDNRISNLEKQVDSMKSYIEALQSRIDFQIKV